MSLRHRLVAVFLLLGMPLAATAGPVENGKKIVAAKNCLVCHSIKGVGGCLAPPLDGIGKRRGKEFIEARITDSPQAVAKFARLYNATELMPHLRLPRMVASDVAAYLQTIPEQQYRVKAHTSKPLLQSTKSTVPGQNIDIGKHVFYNKGCMECHSILGTGGQFGPALDGISKRRTFAFVESRITDAELMRLGVGGEYQEKGTVMPPLGLTEVEIRSVGRLLDELAGAQVAGNHSSE